MRYLFGDYAFDTERRELRRGHDLIPLTPQVFDLLAYLIRNRDRVVSRDDLIEAIWGGRIVSDSALTTRMNAVRYAIGDSGVDQRLIKTLQRKGFRFVGDVLECAQEEEAPTRGVVAGPLAGPPSPPLSLPDRPSLAVLPFTNVSGDSDQDYFADGLTEDLITGLARVRWLFVIARNSSFTFKGRAADVKQVSRELGVRYVLEGSVRRGGEKMRVSAQLVDAITGANHWAERYDRGLDDIFAVQDEITRSVAAAIEPQLLAAEGIRTLSRSAEDLGAWELVARAQTVFCRLTVEDCAAAVEPLERAVEAYPDYAPARGLLGFYQAFSAHMGWIDRERVLLAGRRHAIRAIALDDRYPWGHIALGYCAMMERHTEEAIAAFRRAVSLNPNSAAAHSHLSRGFALSGRDQEAIEHGEEAIRLSPLDPEMALFLGAIAIAHYAAGRYPKAIERSLEAQRLRPGFQGSRRMLCASLAQAGRTDEARSLLATIRREQPDLTLAWISANVPYQTPELMERYLEGFRKAGLGGG